MCTSRRRLEAAFFGDAEEERVAPVGPEGKAGRYVMLLMPDEAKGATSSFWYQMTSHAIVMTQNL
jgi:hypothetical protein